MGNGTSAITSTTTANLKNHSRFKQSGKSPPSPLGQVQQTTTLGTIGTGVWNGTTIAVNKGGTGQTSFAQGWIKPRRNKFVGKHSPTVNYITATSTTATSTFATGGLTVGTNQFVVQQTSGNVGIGTTGPGQKLSIDGTLPVLEMRSGGFMMFRPVPNNYDFNVWSDGTGVGSATILR